MGQDLHCRLAALMPRLRRFGIALGRSADNVDDLARAPRERVQRCQTQGRGGTQSGESTRVRDWPIDESRARCDDGETADEADGDAAGRLAESTIALAAVRRALARLPAAQRAVLVLVCADGMSYKETAEILDIALDTVASRVARARQALHEQMAMQSDASADGDGFPIIPAYADAE